MVGWAMDPDGGQVCPPCANGECTTSGWLCDTSGCECHCRAEHAADLDDRPADKLHTIAADMQAERYQGARFGRDEYGALYAERWGRRPRSTR